MTEKKIQDQIAEDRAHYLDHPDDDEWEEAPAPDTAKARREVGAMISVRLSASEADEIKAAADEAGLPVSAYVRNTVLDHIRRGSWDPTAIPANMRTYGRSVQIELQPGAPVSGGVQSSGALVN